jgi:predicted transposase YbfD/YdcC
MKIEKIGEYFSEVETTEEYHGYFYSVGEALTIVILGSMCGLRNISQIHQWASSRRVSEFLSKHFGIDTIPCYYWLLCLLKLIEPGPPNRCFIQWAQSLVADAVGVISFDGKTIRSTGKTDSYKSPLHIISAHLAEQGITLAQQTVDGKNSEIPAMRELLELLDSEGCIITADALYYQKGTAKAVIKGKGDYVLNVKDNQPILKEEIADYVQDVRLRNTMDSRTMCEKTSGRVEQRTGYTTQDIDWLYGREDWEKLACIGAVNARCTSKKGTSDEWRYYISSRGLTAEELLEVRAFGMDGGTYALAA